uniref:Uncharacterized protein n=1 Tax=Avena sativa TaxID=4498 RepID=A0ACD5THE0_AVESA
MPAALDLCQGREEASGRVARESDAYHGEGKPSKNSQISAHIRSTAPKRTETTNRWSLGGDEAAVDMAALAAHHHRVFSSATPRTRLRDHRRSSSLPFSSSSWPAAHGRPRAARVFRHASSGSSAAPANNSSSLEELARSCTTWTWRGMRVNYLVRGEGPPVLLVHGFGASVAHWRRQNLKDILLSVYGNKDAVDDELVEIIRGPADTEGALDAFVSTVTGPPGPSPIALMPEIKIPVLVLWGDQDPFTPIDGPVGKYFSGLPSELSNVKLHMLEGVGHCPHDDRPDLVHEKLLPWLANLPSAAEPEAALT